MKIEQFLYSMCKNFAGENGKYIGKGLLGGADGFLAYCRSRWAIP